MSPLVLLLLGCTPEETPDPPDVEPAMPPLAEAGDRIIVEVGTPASFDGSASEGVAFTWFFGDGASAEGVTASHTYTQAGNYSAILQVTGEDGTWRTDSTPVIAYLPAASPPPVAASTLVRHEGSLFYVVRDANAVGRIDVSSGAVERASTCPEPTGVAVSTGVEVVCLEDGLRSYDLLLETLSTTEVPGRLHGLMVWDGNTLIADEATGSVGSLSMPDVRGLAAGPHGIYGGRFRNPDHGLIYVGDEAFTIPPDPGPDSDTAIRGVPNQIGHLALSPDGETLFVPVTLSNTYRGEWRDGQPLTHETTIRASLIALDAEGGDVLWRQIFDDQGRGGPVAVHPLGNEVAVAHPGTGTVSLVDAYTGILRGVIQAAGQAIDGMVYSADGSTLYVHAWLDREVRGYDVTALQEGTPLVDSWSTVDGEPLSPEVLLGKRLFHDSFDDRISKHGYLSCAGCHPHGEEDGLVWDFTDRGEGLRNTTSLLGRAGTEMGPLHWSGNFDEIQDFENDMRDAFGGHGFLSESDWDATSDPLGPAKAGLSDELDALAAYVATLDTTPASPVAAPSNGAELFGAHGCVTCHLPPLYTDSSLDTMLRHDVGTLTDASGSRLGANLDGLDTPTLLGVWATPPYLHDGSADTVEDAILAHEGVAVSGPDLVDLADFVRSL